MTKMDILNTYLSQIEEKQEILKKEIELFFNDNKDNAEIDFLLKDTFQDKIFDFGQTYNRTFPKQLSDTLEAKYSGYRTMIIYADLVKYPEELVSSLDNF